MSFRQIWNKVPGRIRDQFSNGNLEFFIGGSLVTFAGYAYWEEQQRQNQMSRIHVDSQQTRKLRDELRKKYLQSVEEEERVRKETISKYKISKSLFQCEVMVAFPLDGQMGLQGVEQGDILDIIEEGVGPDESYSLCRFTGDKVENGITVGQIGWYPARCLKKMDSHQTSKSRWIRWIW